MSRSRCGWIASLGLLCSVLCGCEEPPQIISASPPGVETPPPLPASEKDAAQALGETVVHRQQTPNPVKVDPIPQAAPTAKGEVKTTDSGVKYETITPGEGMPARAGLKVKVLYKGSLTNGEVFDSKLDKSDPFEFGIGISQVIKGWHEGIAGMRVGEHRKLTIPPSAGYGAAGRPPKIPPDSTLIFEIDLLSVE